MTFFCNICKGTKGLNDELPGYSDLTRSPGGLILDWTFFPEFISEKKGGPWAACL